MNPPRVIGSEFRSGCYIGFALGCLFTSAVLCWPGCASTKVSAPENTVEVQQEVDPDLVLEWEQTGGDAPTYPDWDKILPAIRKGEQPAKPVKKGAK